MKVAFCRIKEMIKTWPEHTCINVCYALICYYCDLLTKWEHENHKWQWWSTFALTFHFTNPRLSRGAFSCDNKYVETDDKKLHFCCVENGTRWTPQHLHCCAAGFNKGVQHSSSSALNSVENFPSLFKLLFFWGPTVWALLHSILVLFLFCFFLHLDWSTLAP